MPVSYTHLRKEGCGLKYRVVSVLKDNRPRFLIISDIEEIEILPSKYLKHLDPVSYTHLDVYKRQTAKKRLLFMY